MDLNRRKGATLVELIVMIAAISLFFGIGSRAYTNFNTSKKLEGETKRLVEFLEVAKKRIMSGDKSSISSSCTVSSYSVVISPSSYLLSAQCPTDIQVGSTYELSDNYSLSPVTVKFELFGLGSNAACTILTDNNETICRTISVDTAGTITHSDQQSTCSC